MPNNYHYYTPVKPTPGTPVRRLGQRFCSAHPKRIITLEAAASLFEKLGSRLRIWTGSSSIPCRRTEAESYPMAWNDGYQEHFVSWGKSHSPFAKDRPVTFGEFLLAYNLEVK